MSAIIPQTNCAIATYTFKGKTILITGGGGEIGQATAHRFARDGAHIVLLDINEEKMSEVAQGLEKYGNSVQSLRCDVTSHEEVKEAFAIASKPSDKPSNRIDYIFNNAGFQGAFAQTNQYPDGDFKRVVDINIVGVFNVLKAAAQPKVAGWRRNC